MNMDFLSQLIPGLIGFLLTVMVLSYLIGDNVLFRFATHIFVGATAGYAAAIVFHQVILPHLFQPLLDANTPALARGLALVPLFLCVLMLMKISPQLSWLGGPAVGYLVGVGAAVAVTGATLGTLLPQIAAAAQPFDLFDTSATAGPLGAIGSLINGSIMLVGTIATLVYFQFGARRQPDGSAKRNALVNMLAWLGQFFVAITFGVLFAGLYAAALTALIERLHSLILFIYSLLL